jgi:hypothetical protein
MYEIIASPPPPLQSKAGPPITELRKTLEQLEVGQAVKLDPTRLNQDKQIPYQINARTDKTFSCQKLADGSVLAYRLK